MTTFNSTTTLAAAAIALTATVGLTLPASATTYEPHQKMSRSHWHHGSQNAAYRSGYRHGWRDGHVAAAAGMEPGLQSGRSAYVAPGAVVAPVDPGVFGNGGLLGLGILGGNGVLGSGVLDGRGALGVGVLGF